MPPHSNPRLSRLADLRANSKVCATFSSIAHLSWVSGVSPATPHEQKTLNDNDLTELSEGTFNKFCASLATFVGYYIQNVDHTVSRSIVGEKPRNFTFSAWGNQVTPGHVLGTATKGRRANFGDLSPHYCAPFLTVVSLFLITTRRHVRETVVVYRSLLFHNRPLGMPPKQPPNRNTITQTPGTLKNYIATRLDSPKTLGGFCQARTSLPRRMMPRLPSLPPGDDVITVHHDFLGVHQNLTRIKFPEPLRLRRYIFNFITYFASGLFRSTNRDVIFCFNSFRRCPQAQGASNVHSCCMFSSVGAIASVII